MDRSSQRSSSYDLPEEDDLVSQAARGSKKAFGVLYKAYAPRIYAVSFGFLMNRDDALDITQVTFLRAWKALPGFRSGCPFFPWLYRIARNRCMSRLSRKKSRPVTVEFNERHAPSGGGQDRLVELRKDIGRALGMLTPEQREVIILRHFHDLSYKEIAKILDCPEGTVMSRLHNSRKALRRFLSDWGDEV